MKSHLARILRGKKKYLLAALGAPLLAMGQAAHAEIVLGPLTISAAVHEALLPSPTIFDDEHSFFEPTETDRAEYLYPASQGQNFSGRSTDIKGAFASSLAEGNHSGGVGVTSWIGGSPSLTNPDALEQLAAHATWTQDITDGTIPTVTKIRLEIPALQVGLIDVPPNRSRISAAETATAEASLAFIITHADGGITKGPLFEFGLRAFETQLELSPGVFSNFAVVDFIGLNSKTEHLFDSFKFNGDEINPRFNINAVSTEVEFGTLQPGDVLDFVYQLTAEGTTHGFERGFVAFLGDPFEVDGSSGAFVVTTGPAAAAVPEPATWVLMILGFGAVAGMAGRRRASALPRSQPRSLEMNWRKRSEVEPEKSSRGGPSASTSP